LLGTAASAYAAMKTAERMSRDAAKKGDRGVDG
jgi:hypothetical protein